MPKLQLRCERSSTDYPLSFDFRASEACGDPLSVTYETRLSRDDFEVFL